MPDFTAHGGDVPPPGGRLYRETNDDKGWYGTRCPKGNCMNTMEISFSCGDVVTRACEKGGQECAKYACTNIQSTCTWDGSTCQGTGTYTGVSCGPPLDDNTCPEHESVAAGDDTIDTDGMLQLDKQGTQFFMWSHLL